MRWKSESYSVEAERLSYWHPWFAWKPVRLDNTTMCWLKYVLRKRYIRGHDMWGIPVYGYEYRDIK